MATKNKYTNLNRTSLSGFYNYKSNKKQASPVSDTQVDLSKIVANKKPVIQEIVEPPVQNPVTPFVEAPQVSPNTPTTQTQEDPRIKLQEEIDALGLNISKKESQRTADYEDNGIFEDVQQLNQLKDKLRAAEDKQIAIPIEERQRLRGHGATKTELAQSTRPQLENAALEALTASRQASGLSDVISTNIAIIDQRLEAEYEEKKYVYDTKINQLQKIEKLHSDILNADQASALERQKFSQNVQLESLKTDNSLRNDLIKELVKQGVSGVELEGLASGTLNDILSYSGKRSSDWNTLTYENALQVLDTDDLARYEKYKKLDPDSQAKVKQGTDTMQGANNIIKIIETMLGDTEGLANSVGHGFGNMDFNIFGAGYESSAFRAQAKTLISSQTLETLKKLKQTGATLGAISEKELNILINAQQSLGAIMDGDQMTGRFELDEGTFKTELKTMRMAAMKTYIASNIGADAYADGGYVNLDGTNDGDYETISNLYNLQKERAVSGVNDYSSELDDEGNIVAATEVIQAEEGFRSDAYQDSTGTWTIGYGTTQVNGRAVQQGDRVSKEQAQSLMNEQILNEYTSFVDQIQSDITPNQFAALTSFEYNLGSNIWNDSHGQAIISAINRGAFEEAGQLMLAYNKSRENGVLKENPVLVQRRKREANLLLT